MSTSPRVKQLQRFVFLALTALLQPSFSVSRIFCRFTALAKLHFFILLWKFDGKLHYNCPSVGTCMCWPSGSTHLLLWDRVSQWPGAHWLDWVAREPQGSICLYLPSTEMINVCLCSCLFYCGFFFGGGTTQDPMLARQALYQLICLLGPKCLSTCF